MKLRMIKHMALAIVLAIGIPAFSDIAKLGVLVVDDTTGKPIPNVKVTGIFHKDNGWLRVKGPPEPDLDEVVTDANGRCRVWGRTNIGKVFCSIDSELPGYYWEMQGGGHNFRSKNLLGIWQPDNVVVTIRLQRVEHPIPLFVKYVSNASPVSYSRDIFPKGEDTVRYDLVMGDWLPPVGSGKVADVEFTRHPRKTLYEIEMQKFGETKKYVAYRDSMTVNFPGDHNGLVELHPSPGKWLKIRTAPEVGYVPKYQCWLQDDKFKPATQSYVSAKETKSYDENRCFCFRIRTKRDKRGDVIEAYYGKIYGDIFFSHSINPLVPVSNVCMLYYLNLTPLDRNLEWDRKTNLNPEKMRMGYEYQNNCRP